MLSSIAEIGTNELGIVGPIMDPFLFLIVCPDPRLMYPHLPVPFLFPPERDLLPYRNLLCLSSCSCVDLLFRGSFFFHFRCGAKQVATTDVRIPCLAGWSLERKDILRSFRRHEPLGSQPSSWDWNMKVIWNETWLANVGKSTLHVVTSLMQYEI